MPPWGHLRKGGRQARTGEAVMVLAEPHGRLQTAADRWFPIAGTAEDVRGLASGC